MQSTFPSGETVCTCPFCKSEHKIIFGLQKSEEDGGKSNAIKKIDLQEVKKKSSARQLLAELNYTEDQKAHP